MCSIKIAEIQMFKKWQQNVVYSLTYRYAVRPGTTVLRVLVLLCCHTSQRESSAVRSIANHLDVGLAAQTKCTIVREVLIACPRINQPCSLGLWLWLSYTVHHQQYQSQSIWYSKLHLPTTQAFTVANKQGRVLSNSYEYHVRVCSV